MTLLDRILGVEGIDPGTRIPIHQFGYILRVYVRSATVGRGQVVTYIEDNFGGLNATEQSHLSEFADIIDAISSEEERIDYVEYCEAVMGVTSMDTSGLTSKAWVKSELGLSNG